MAPMYWDCGEAFAERVRIQGSAPPATQGAEKRGHYKRAARVLDPQGYLRTVTIQAKLFVQSL